MSEKVEATKGLESARREFEKWAIDWLGDAFPFTQVERGDYAGEYTFRVLERMWQAWQAAQVRTPIEKAASKMAELLKRWLDDGDVSEKFDAEVEAVLKEAGVL